MTKLTFVARLKSWGVDYPVDGEGNVQVGKPPTAYHVSLYLLGTVNDKGEEGTARANPDCKSCMPQVDLHFTEANLKAIEKAVVFGPGKLTLEFEAEPAADSPQ
jgi:hypothetical protein